METTVYLLKEFDAFTLETTIAEVKSFFNETTFNHFPIVNNQQLIGLISETDIEGIDENEKEIGYFQYLFHFFFIEEVDNLVEIIKVFAANKTNLVPAIDLEKKYIGYYELTDILQLCNETPFFNSDGIVLLLEKEIRSFSFSEISQIVESNNGKIFGLYISDSNATTVKITLKLSVQDVNETLQSFRRYDYSVISNHKEDYYLEDLKERSKYLQKYLNI